jgi:tripartite-type tricarboxylate transporter receptor subunit TctC
MMGSPESENGHLDDEGPQHAVTIAKPFAVGKFDVTFAEWDACADAGACSRVLDGGWGRSDRPVINVSWDDAKLYVAWLSRMTGKPYHLLSEAEWEYAARARATTAYYWGDDVARGRANCHGCGSEWELIQTSPVGSFKPNAFGLYDMAGNVWQWVEDTYRRLTLVFLNPPSAEQVINAPADGYTLLMATATNVINASVYDKLNFNFISDVSPVARIVEAALVMEVSPSFPAKTVPEFIAYAKANPGKINYASAGVGSPNHVAGEMFKMMAGVDMVHVPYRGSTAGSLTDLINGRVQVIFDPVLSSVEYIKAGTLRALAVTTATPSKALPGIPTVGEFLPGFEVSAWHGLVAPKNTAPEIITKLSNEVSATLSNPELRARFFDLGAAVIPSSSPAEFGKFIAADAEKWARVVKFAGIKAS